MKHWPVFPQRLLGCAPSIAAFRERLLSEQVLMMLRELAQVHLQALPRPLGFHHSRTAR